MHTRRVTTAIAALLYVASLLLPVGQVIFRNPSWMTVEPSHPFSGHLAFLVTLFAPLIPSWERVFLFASWLANPVFWLGLYWCLKDHTAHAAMAGAVSTGLGLSIFPLEWDLVARWPGYWVWLASFLTLFAGSVFELKAARSRPVENVKRP
jgi:hypothetical protein